MWTAEFLIIAGLAFLFAGFVKGTIGIGMPTIVIALLATTLDLKIGIALILVPTFATNLWQSLTGGAFIATVRRLWSFLAGSCVGIWFGVGVLAESDAGLISGLFGILLCLYATLSLLTPQIPPPGRYERLLSPPVGAVSGLVAGMLGSFVIPGSLYLQALGMPRETFIQAMGIAFVIATLALGVALAGHGLLPARLGLISAAAVLPAIAGMATGQALRRRIPEERFRRIFFGGMLGLGLYMAGREFV